MPKNNGLDMPKKEHREEILENLVALHDETGRPVEPRHLARRSGIDVHELEPMVRHLEAEGYIESAGGLKPTPKGADIGRKMVRKHRLLERFLQDVLGMQGRSVHEEACRLEHALSDEAEAALCRYLGHPQNCPDDNRPIPACDRGVDCSECASGRPHADGSGLARLTEVRSGCAARIMFIRGGRTSIQRLRDMGLVTGAVVKIVKAAPMGGPVELEICSTRLAIGRGIAEKVFVGVL